MTKRLMALGVGAVLLCAAVMTAPSFGKEAGKVATPPPAAVHSATAGPALVQPPHGEEGTSATETKSAGIEESKGEEEADENLPNGGHADPEGVDVEHQFEGIE